MRTSSGQLSDQYWSLLKIAGVLYLSSYSTYFPFPRSQLASTCPHPSQADETIHIIAGVGTFYHKEGAGYSYSHSPPYQ